MGDLVMVPFRFTHHAKNFIHGWLSSKINMILTKTMTHVYVDLFILLYLSNINIWLVLQILIQNELVLWYHEISLYLHDFHIGHTNEDQYIGKWMLSMHNISHGLKEPTDRLVIIKLVRPLKCWDIVSVTRWENLCIVMLYSRSILSWCYHIIGTRHSNLGIRFLHSI
jgi:hypothetical protein